MVDTATGMDEGFGEADTVAVPETVGVYRPNPYQIATRPARDAGDGGFSVVEPTSIRKARATIEATVPESWTDEQVETAVADALCGILTAGLSHLKFEVFAYEDDIDTSGL